MSLGKCIQPSRRRKELTGASMISGNIETIAAEYLLRYYSLKGDILTASDIQLDPEIAIYAMKLLYDNYRILWSLTQIGGGRKYKPLLMGNRQW